MKRDLLLLPLVAAAGGLLLFLAHRGQLGPITLAKTNAPAAPTAPSAPAPAAPAAKPVTSFSNSDLGDLAGGIRFTVTAKGLPLKDASITVQKSGTPDWMAFKTETDGTQYLHGLPPAEYNFRIDHPDFLPYDASLFIDPGKTGQVAADLKPGGRVYGVVTDKAGVPLPKTRCFLFSADAGKSLPSSAVESDEKGQYLIKPIPNGSYGIRFRHAKYKPAERPNILFRSPTDEYKVDVTLELGAKVSGRVIDDEGKPIVEAIVVAGTKGSAAMARSAADGTFSIGGLNELPVNLQASKAKYGKVTLRNLPANGPDLEIKLPRAGTIAGRVVTEEPPRRIMLVLSKFDEETGGVVMADTKTIPDPPGGKFEMTDVAPGNYWLDITIEGYDAIDRPQVLVSSGQTLDGVVVTFKKKS